MSQIEVNQLKPLIAMSIKEGVVMPELWQAAGMEPDRRLELILGLPQVFRSVFNSFKPDGQNVFRTAVVEVTKDWSLEKDGPNVLAGFASLAVDTKARGVINPLGYFVETD